MTEITFHILVLFIGCNVSKEFWGDKSTNSCVNLVKIAKEFLIFISP